MKLGQSSKHCIHGPATSLYEEQKKDILSKNSTAVKQTGLFRAGMVMTQRGTVQ